MSVPLAGTRALTMLGLALVVLVFSVPLFHNLGGLDMENDEASYSYQVDRILDTGHWMTPLGVPFDNDFVEKPPLMFWLEAAAIKAGVLPFSNAGLRFLPTLFGALAFVYVYLLGCRVQGPFAGVLAALILFTFNPLLFDHGLRTNNMEGAVFLSYCAGMFHFVAWLDSQSRAGSRVHAFAAVLAFTLGFMTKFVAAAFLPMLWVIALLARNDAAVVMRTRWREWLAPATFAVVAIPPWFIYQTIRMGSGFWKIIIGQHVYQRFTTGLDASHLQPWSFYPVHLWTEPSVEGARWVVAAGLVFVVFRAIVKKDWVARLILAWAIVPLALMSIGSSKLLYYADPFFPPMALAAGWLAGEVVRWLRTTALVTSLWPGGSVIRDHVPAAIRGTLAFVAAVAIAVAAWTLVVGRFKFTIGGVGIFGNASVIRPLLMALVLAVFAGKMRARLLSSAAAVALLFLFPVDRYAPTTTQMNELRRPLTALRDCVHEHLASDAALRTGTYIGSGPLPTHAFYFYLRKLGPFFFREDGLSDEVRARLFDPNRQSLVVLSEKDVRLWEMRLDAEAATGRPRLNMPATVPAPLDSLVLMPGAYAVCADAALAAIGDSRVPR